MADDLFGAKRNEHLTRFLTTPTAPKKKVSRFVPVKVLRVPEEMAEKIRQRRAADEYQEKLEELQRWKGKMPQDEWRRLKAKVEALKP
jgi:hypothetical protein